MLILREIVTQHESNLVPGDPQLNWCDYAVMVSNVVTVVEFHSEAGKFQYFFASQ